MSKKGQEDDFSPKRLKEWPDSIKKDLPREKLNPDLQKLIDSQDDWLDDIYEGSGPDTTDTAVRYAAYMTRIRTIMISASRYVAYTSDIGESFRPVAHPYLVKGAYGISWAYLVGDVSHEGWKAYKRNQRLLHPEQDQHFDATQSKELPAPGAAATQVKEMPAQGAAAVVAVSGPVHIPAIEDYRAVMAQRALFQGVASMGLPAFTIHSIVKYSGKAFKNAANTTIRTWAPIGLGLAAVPALPFMFDKPVEEAVEWIFYHGFKAIGGENAVGQRHETGRMKEMQRDAKAQKRIKEKEL